MAPRQSPSSSFFGELRSRELNGFKVRQRPYLGDFSSEPGGFIIEHENNPSPPLALSFCKSSRRSHILAVSDEEGYVSFYDTWKHLPRHSSCWDKTAEAKVSEWVAHENAIFDICWAKDDSQLLTASGDQTIKIWNAERRKCIGLLTGHTGSVKSIASHSSNSDLFVSGSRDGSFAIWDLRCKSGSVNNNGVACILYSCVVKEAHSYSQGRRTRRLKADSKSVTSVLYLKDEISIASAGALDSVVKFWDTRNLKSSIIQAGPDIPSISKKEKTRHGISCLSQDSSGVLLTASCMDNRIYLYDVLQLSRGPIKIFSGSKISSFYVKSAISPDGSHILSGSGDGNAYMWRVNKPESAPASLNGHEKEVTAVAWCSSEVGKLATSSDDYMVHIWNVNKESCISTKSPNSLRRRVVAAPSSLCRKLDMDESTLRSKDIDDSLCAENNTTMNQLSPLGTISHECITPESVKKRKLELFPAGGLDMHTPEPTFDSPSSVLNPPPSLRRTIRDYFLQPHETVRSHSSS